MAAKKNQKKAKDQPAKDIAKAEKQKQTDELSEEQLDKVAGGFTIIKKIDKADPHLML